MLGRIAVMAASIALVAGCAGLEPAGRNAQRSPAPAQVTRQAQTPPPPATLPPPQASAPTQPAPPAPRLQAPPPPRTTAPTLTAPAPTPPTPSATTRAAPTPQPAPPARDVSDEDSDVDDDAIVVPGQRDVQVQPPGGDPRSNAERREDVRAWDQCVIGVQSAYESDPMRPELTSPEEYCRQSLGMNNRTAVPESRRQRQR